ncbi:MAG: rod-binding protein [Proteobacteria bacterium]|nr:rod-binding protein [Pseudomonadota bacterium]
MKNVYAAAQDPSFSRSSLRSINGESRTREPNIEKVAQEFESYLIFTMLKELEKTTNSSKKGSTEQTYTSLLYEKVGDYIAKKGIGIRDMLTKHMEKKY